MLYPLSGVTMGWILESMAMRPTDLSPLASFIRSAASLSAAMSIGGPYMAFSLNQLFEKRPTF